MGQRKFILSRKMISSYLKIKYRGEEKFLEIFCFFRVCYSTRKNSSQQRVEVHFFKSP